MWTGLLAAGTVFIFTMNELYNQTYEYGNYTTIKGKEIVMVKAWAEGKITIEGEQGYWYETTIKDIVPLVVTPEVLNKTIFTCVHSVNELLHTRFIYEIQLNKRMHYLNGHVYRDKAIWTFCGLNIVYFHTLQNLLRIIDPKVVLKLW